MERPAPLVLLVEDNDDERATMVDWLEEHNYRVVACPSAEAALEALGAGLRPTIISLDMHLPGMSGRRFRQCLLDDPRTADITVFILTGHPLEPEEVMSLGVAGYMLKPYDTGLLNRTIETLHRLTQREEQVLRCVQMGLSNKEIARRLAISPATVKFHIRSLMRKTGCESRVELVTHFHYPHPKVR